MNRNLGATSLRLKRRSDDPMKTYDALPEPLRRWLSEACRPWSPASAKRIWNKAHAKGLSIEDTLSALTLAEANTLSRDHYNIKSKIKH